MLLAGRRLCSIVLPAFDLVQERSCEFSVAVEVELDQLARKTLTLARITLTERCFLDALILTQVQPIKRNCAAAVADINANIAAFADVCTVVTDIHGGILQLAQKVICGEPLK